MPKGVEGEAGPAAMFSDEELSEVSGLKRGGDYIEVTCGCTSHRYGDAVGRLRVFVNGDLEITCECTPGCDEGLLPLKILISSSLSRPLSSSSSSVKQSFDFYACPMQAILGSCLDSLAGCRAHLLSKPSTLYWFDHSLTWLYVIKLCHRISFWCREHDPPVPLQCAFFSLLASWRDSLDTGSALTIGV